MNIGTCFIVSAPSGTGKSSLIRSLLNRCIFNNIQLSISYTTRTIRPGENNGEHYHFISIEKFEKMIKNNLFLEYAKVYNNYYGTSQTIIKKNVSMGYDILLDIDWQGAKQLRNKNIKSKSIFILPPSKKELFKRLKNRRQDSNNVIYERMKSIVSDISHCSEYDYLVVNDDFEKTLKELEKIIRYERLNLYLKKRKHFDLIKKLIQD